MAPAAVARERQVGRAEDKEHGMAAQEVEVLWPVSEVLLQAVVARVACVGKTVATEVNAASNNKSPYPKVRAGSDQAWEACKLGAVDWVMRHVETRLFSGTGQTRR